MSKRVSIESSLWLLGSGVGRDTTELYPCLHRWRLDNLSTWEKVLSWKLSSKWPGKPQTARTDGSEPTKSSRLTSPTNRPPFGRSLFFKKKENGSTVAVAFSSRSVDRVWAPKIRYFLAAHFFENCSIWIRFFFSSRALFVLFTIRLGRRRSKKRWEGSNFQISEVKSCVRIAERKEISAAASQINYTFPPRDRRRLPLLPAIDNTHESAINLIAN
jgi:hypothetical protein